MSIYLISQTSQGPWFHGLDFKHPGTEPRGHWELRWSYLEARLLTDLELHETLRSLEELGVTNYTVCTVQEHKL